MNPTAYDRWAISREMANLPNVGDLEPMTPVFRALVERLRGYPILERRQVLDGFATAMPDAEGFIQAVVGTSPNSPEPKPEARQRPVAATLVDLKKVVVDTTWPWPGWLAGGVLNTLASNPGVGKTILAMNLAKALWRGDPWPDGSANPFPAGTRTLWIPGDRHYSQLIDLAGRYGLPDEALLFNATPDQPTGGLDLDEAENLDRLQETVYEERPGLVIVDTVGGTTLRNLGTLEEANAYFGPLQEIATNSQTSFLLLTHLSKAEDPLGRRIIGSSRTVWKLARPDAENQPDRRKLWVDKSMNQIPRPLGMTIGEDGCTFDATPPEAKGPGADKPRKAKKDRLGECTTWLEKFMGGETRLIKEARAAAEAMGFSIQCLYDARDALALATSEKGGKKYWVPPDETGWQEFEL